MPQHYATVRSCVDDLIGQLGHSLCLGVPLGIGKPNIFINELYERVAQNEGLHLKILTALSLGLPKPKSDLERRFAEPFIKRVYDNYPDLNYVQDRLNNCLPANIDVVEFFLKSGEYTHHAYSQQHYLSSNYTHVARDMLIQGVNVIAQYVAARERDGVKEYSLSTNPDVTLDLVELALKRKHPIFRILVVNHAMPFMENDAIVNLDNVDAIIEDPTCTHQLFSAPNQKVELTDYAIGLHASTLVRDGGTLQIGIGSLGDAIAHALILRHRYNAQYMSVIKALRYPYAQLETFSKGLYGCSEMFVNGFMALIEAGIIKRRVYDHVGIQQLLNAGIIDEHVNIRTLYALLEHQIIETPLSHQHVDLLKQFGVFKEEVTVEDGWLVIDGHRISNTLHGSQNLILLEQYFLGDQLKGGHFLTAGFILGPKDFYQKLRHLVPSVAEGINMTGVSHINHLYGHERLSIQQRRDMCFINTGMMVTLLGDVVSDGLASGSVVSGVGGQYNFVAQAHEIPDARSIMLVRAVRYHQGRAESNIIWNYAHTTIPRHLRDIVISEYGIADLRGQTDSEIVKRLLAICDSRFQAELLRRAKTSGKLEKSYQIPQAYSQNFPETVARQLVGLRNNQLLPDFPFGTDFTVDELAIIVVLQRIKARLSKPWQLLRVMLSGVREETPKTVPASWLIRLDLADPKTLKAKLLRAIFIRNS